MISVYSQTYLAFPSYPGVDNKCHPLYICNKLGLIPRFTHCTSQTEVTGPGTSQEDAKGFQEVRV